MIDLGRNFSWDKNVDKTLWADLQNHDITKIHRFTALDLSMMAMALGFKYRSPKVFVKSAIGSGGDIRGENDTKKQKAVASVLSIAVHHTGSLDILEEDYTKVRRIGEEYANGGLSYLHDIFMKSTSDKIVIQKLLKLIKDS